MTKVQRLWSALPLHRGKVAEFSAGLQTYKEFGPGCDRAAAALAAMTELAEWCMPVLQAVREITKPAKLVVQTANGGSLASLLL